MPSNKINITSFIFCIVFFPACNKENKPCTQQIISVTLNRSDPCIGSGSITVLSPVGNGILYSIGGSYQSGNAFNGLLPGNYVVSVKQNDCSQTLDTLISVQAEGPLFTAVKNVLTTHCVSCHGGLNPQAGINFSLHCDIVANWYRIEQRAVMANPSPMPQAGLIAVSERNKIMVWINAGHGFAN